MRPIRALLFVAFALAVVAVAGSNALAGGVSGPAFYVDGVLYRTVGTPTDLSHTGAPAHSFDTIYSFGGAQPYNVATAAPGDRGFNGGRWQVHALAFPNGYQAALSHDANGSGDLDSAAEVWAALGDGSAVDHGIVRSFVCTVNKVPRGR